MVRYRCGDIPGTKLRMRRPVYEAPPGGCADDPNLQRYRSCGAFVSDVKIVAWVRASRAVSGLLFRNTPVIITQLPTAQRRPPQESMNEMFRCNLYARRECCVSRYGLFSRNCSTNRVGFQRT